MVRNRNTRKRPTPRPSEKSQEAATGRDSDTFTVYDQLAYLMFELEVVVTRSDMKWSPELAARTQARLESLAGFIRLAVSSETRG
jgi:hypothetical protein